MLDADLEVDFSWSAENVTFLFRNGATLRTFGSNINIKLSDCQLFNAALEIEGGQGECQATLERCNWRGDYDSMARISALKCRRTALTVRDSSFVTLNARAIRAQLKTLTVKSSTFTHCGHAELYGGAIWHSDESRSIEDCQFDRCVAALGGALRFNRIADIKKCKFLNCKSKEEINGFKKNEATIAIFANLGGSCALYECTLQNSSSFIKDVNTHSAIARSNLNNSRLYFNNTGNSKSSLDECTLIDSSEINLGVDAVRYGYNPFVFNED